MIDKEKLKSTIKEHGFHVYRKHLFGNYIIYFNKLSFFERFIKGLVEL